MLAVAAALTLLVTRPAATMSPASAPAHSFYAVQISAVVERPAVAPVLVSRPAQIAVVHSGQTVESLARFYGADMSTIRWANALGPTAQPALGATLLIPPGKGALVHVHAIRGQRIADDRYIGTSGFGCFRICF